MYSGKPTASIVVSELAAEHNLGLIDGRRKLNDAGRKAVEIITERITSLVDDVLASPARPLVSISAPAATKQPTIAGCSCGSGVPVQKITIDGQIVEFLALPLIFASLRERGLTPETAGDVLLEDVAIYNSIPEELKSSYRVAILREYSAFWNGGKK